MAKRSVTQTSSAAKFCRPSVDNPLRRTRLFEQLNKRPRPGVSWVTGPAGAGKTTLVSTWTDSIEGTCLWYRIDADDSDGVSFFHRLKTCIRTALPGRRLQVPTYSREYLNDLEGFTRLYFRDLAISLPPASTIVLDDFQCVAKDSALNHILASGLMELSHAVDVVVVSRVGPPPCFMRMVANGHIRLIGGEALKLDAQEIEALARNAGETSHDAVAHIIQLSQGWAAGARLLLSYSKSELAFSGRSGEQAIFDYFTAELLGTLTQSAQAILLQTALLPSFTGLMASELTENPDAPQVVDDLCHRNFFMERRSGSPVIYRYHDLFRAFLLSHGQAIHTPQERSALTRRAAGLLIRDSRHEEALPLLRTIPDWPQVLETLMVLAPSWLAQGRQEVLMENLDVLPEQHRSDPRTLYWRGKALLGLDTNASREVLKRAYESFERKNDRPWTLLSAAGVVDSYFIEYGDVHALRRWSPVLSKHVALISRDVNTADLLEIYISLVLTIAFTASHTADVEECVLRVLQLAHRESNPERRLRAATALLSYGAYSYDTSRARQAIQLAETLKDPFEIADVVRYRWHDYKAYWHMVAAEYEDEAVEVSILDSLSSRMPSTLSPMSVLSDRVHSALCNGDLSTAQSVFARMEMSANLDKSMDRVFLISSSMWIDLYNMKFERIHEKESALCACLDAMQFAIHQALHRIPLICALCELGRIDEARETLHQATQALEDSVLKGFQTLLIWVRAWVLLRTGEIDSAKEALAVALHRARHLEHAPVLNRLRCYASELADAAVAYDIEPEFARDLARRFQWKRPRASASDRQPIEVRCLGEFCLLVNGIPWVPRGKAMKRPLSLLKLLCANAGSWLSMSTVADTLWPESEGDRAHGAVEVTLLRLRRLLGHRDAILRAEGKLALNAQRIRSDVQEFLRWKNEIERNLGQISDSEFSRLSGQYYRADFLPDSDDEPWVIGQRNRLRACFSELEDKRSKLRTDSLALSS